eukprot:11213601-Lingulodinium_polyedra.AAC.1
MPSGAPDAEWLSAAIASCNHVLQEPSSLCKVSSSAGEMLAIFGDWPASPFFLAAIVRLFLVGVVVAADEAAASAAIGN